MINNQRIGSYNIPVISRQNETINIFQDYTNDASDPHDNHLGNVKFIENVDFTRKQ